MIKKGDRFRYVGKVFSSLANREFRAHSYSPVSDLWKLETLCGVVYHEHEDEVLNCPDWQKIEAKDDEIEIEIENMEDEEILVPDFEKLNEDFNRPVTNVDKQRILDIIANMEIK